MGGPEIRLPREGMDRLVPPLLAEGVLILAYIREQLNAHNLISTYPRGKLVAFQQPGLRPPLGVTHFRTADGSWNNLADPKEGAAYTRFLRNVDLSVTCAEEDAAIAQAEPTRDQPRASRAPGRRRWPTKDGAR